MKDKENAALTHLDAEGRTHMVDVGQKPVTGRKSGTQAVFFRHAEEELPPQLQGVRNQRLRVICAVERQCSCTWCRHQKIYIRPADLVLHQRIL